MGRNQARYNLFNSPFEKVIAFRLAVVMPIEDTILQAKFVLFDLRRITMNVIFSLTMPIISLVPRPKHIFKT